MFEKMVEQAQSAFKPMTDVFALNTEVMEKLAEKQAGYLSESMNDSINYAKELAEQKDLAGFYDLQKSYLDAVQSKMVSVAKESYELISEAQEKTGEMLKDAFEECVPQMASMMNVEPVKSAPATKPKSAPKAASAKSAEK